MIPILNLKPQYLEIQQEVEAAVLEVLNSTRYILGPNVRAFEQEFADYHEQPYAIGVGSGTDALHIAVRALDIGPGDEVIVPSFTFGATAGAVKLAGATPVFCDIDPVDFNMGVSQIEQAITPQTKAIIVVHIFGHPAPIEAIVELAKKHNLKVIEDTAQACGAKVGGRLVGTFGDVACYSFFPTKNLGCAGDGGALLCSDEQVFNNLTMIKNHGSPSRYTYDRTGTNSRLDEVQAAILRIKLRHLDRWNADRRKVAQFYDENLPQLGIVTPKVRPGCEHIYHQYTIRVAHRNAIQEHLNNQGVGTIVYYPKGLHKQKAFCPPQPLELPQTDLATQEVLSLPVFGELTEDELQTIIKALTSATKEYAQL